MKIFKILSFAIYGLLISCANKDKKSQINSLESNEKVQWILDKKNATDTSYIHKAISTYKDLIKKNKSKEVFNILTSSATYLADQEKFDIAYTNFIEREFLIRRPNIDIKNKLRVIYYLVFYYNAKMNFKKVKEYGNIVSKLQVNDKDDKNNLARIYTKIVNVHFHSSQLDSSYHYNNKSIRLYQEINDKVGVLESQINAVRLKLFNKQYKECLKKIDSIIAEAEKLKDDNLILRAYLQKIEIYSILESPFYNSLNDTVYNRFVNNKKLLSSRRLICKLYYMQSLLFRGDYKKTKVLLKDIEKEIIDSNFTTVIDFYNYLNQLYQIEINSVDLDTDFYNQLLLKYKKEKDFFGCQNVYPLLISDATRKGDLKKALALSEESFKTYNLYASQENANKIMEYEVKYKTEKLNNKIQINKIELEKRNRTILLLGTIIFILCSFVFIYYLIDKQKKLRKIDEEKKYFTNQLFYKIEEERKRIATDLHDSISCDLLELKTMDNFKKDGKILEIINNLRQISRNLHPSMFERLRLKSSIEDLVIKLQDNQDFFISADIEYNNSLEVNVELQLYRIVQETLNNIIKHSQAKAVLIVLKENKDSIVLEIKDNGVGFDFKEKFESKNLLVFIV